MALAQVSPDGEPGPISVSALVEEIVTSHPERLYYEAVIEAADSEAAISARLPDPELSIDLGRKRLRDASGAAISDGTVWSVSVMQTFPWPGRLSLRKAIANRQLELAQLGLARFESALTARARLLAFGLQAANIRALAVREVSDRIAALKQSYLARDPAGITPLLETRAIEAGELALQPRVIDAELAVQAALLELNQLRGVAAETPLQIATATLSFSVTPPLGELLAAARENNFEYKMQLVELEQQGFAVSLARNQRYPELSVGPYVSRDGVEGRETIIGLVLNVPLPITGRTGAAVEQAEARRRQAEATARVAALDLERQVVTTMQSFNLRLDEIERWSPETIQSFRDAAELADRHYRAGAVSLTTYLDLQYGYLDAVEALLATQEDILSAGLLLQQLTGLDLNFVIINP